MKEGLEIRDDLEREETNIRLRFILVRHGEQRDRRKSDSKLTNRGIAQIQAFANSYVDEIEGSPRRIVHVDYSGRERTKQSASIILAVLNSRRPDCIGFYKNPREKKFLQTADSIEAVRTSYPDKEGKELEFLLESNEDELKNIGAQTPEELKNWFLSRVLRMGRYIIKNPFGEVVDWILVTHENFGPYLLKGQDEPSKLRPNHGEAYYLELQEPSQDLVVKFRDKIYPLALNPRE